MIPIRDDNPQLKPPLVTYSIIALNILSWVLLQGLGSDQSLNTSVCQYGFIPANLTSASTHTPVCDGGLGWQGIFTSMFMHGSWMHLIGNLWFLWVFGDNVEDSMGARRFAIFYVLCGVIAAMTQLFSQPDSPIPMVGASGAIGGVMGAYLMLYPHVRVHMLFILFLFITTFRIPAYVMLVYWIAIQILGVFSSSGVGGGVAFWAHVGGFVAGAVLVWFFKDKKLLARHPYHGWR